MAKNIIHNILFRTASPKALYELYMNSKKHSKATAAPANISAKVGGEFSTHGGYITGKNIDLIKDMLIVQTWRAQGWENSDPDSIFIIHLQKKGKNTALKA